MCTTITDGYSVGVDEANEESWREALATFEDANIYQTWPYDVCAHPRSTVSRLTLRQAGRIVSVAQARIVVVPGLRRGLALVRWGPLWKRRDEPADPAHLQRSLAALVEEYAVRRKLAVQVLPAPSCSDTPTVESALGDAGFRRSSGHAPGCTILLDLQKELDQLQAGLHKKWRNCLNYARRVEQEVVEGESDDLFAQFSVLYERMHARKRFQSSTNLRSYRRLQERLGPDQKMRVFLCRSDSCPYAGAVVSLLGDTGVWLFGASDGEGLEKKSSYLVQWKVIEWLKKNQARTYNLNGVSRARNPGSYCFKSRLAGSNGEEVVSLEPFLAAASPISLLLADAGGKWLGSFRGLRHRAANVLRTQPAR